MNKLLIIKDDHNSQLNYQSILEREESLIIDIELSSNLKKINFNNYQLAFVERSIVNDCELEKINLAFFIIENNRIENNRKKNEALKLNEIGIIKEDNALNEIENLIKLFKISNHSFSKIEIEKLLQNQVEVYQQVKKMHTRVVPLREYSHKGIKLYSKYMVGRSNGGEYYGVDGKKDDLYIFQSSSKSYLINSLLISFAEKLSDYKTSDELFSEFIKFLGNHLDNEATIDSIDFLWLKIDSQTLKVEGLKKGLGELFLNNKSIDIEETNYLNQEIKDKIYFTFQMNRNDKLLWLSSGAIETIKALNNSFDLNNFLTKGSKNTKKEMDQRSFFEELFFELSDQGNQEFLFHDSICLLMEIGANVIHKI